MKGLQKLNALLSGWAEAIGLAAAVFMVVLTCVDVLGAKLFLRPVPGSLDMMMLAQLVAVSFAGAGALLHGRHVAVDFFVTRLPSRAQSALGAAVAAASLVLFAVVLWRLAAHGAELQRSHEVTATAALPLAPFAYAAAAAMLPLCLALLEQLLRSLIDVRRTLRHEP